jgi:hypothetical protein
MRMDTQSGFRLSTSSSHRLFRSTTVFPLTPALTTFTFSSGCFTSRRL